MLQLIMLIILKIYVSLNSKIDVFFYIFAVISTCIVPADLNI